jgi:3-dehydroquinate synthase
MLKYSLNVNDSKYNVYLHENFQGFKNVFDKYIDKNKIFVITDSNLSEIYSDVIGTLIKDYDAKVISFAAGEENKSIETINNIYEFLIENNADRSSIIIAFGGGVVGDITGFVAATYMRGIKFINVPTTLTSQVDSSIGGKTGYNFGSIKNLIGCFYNPMFVYISTSFLKTLDKELLLDGMGEVIKYGVISSKSLLDFIKGNSERLINYDDEVLLHIISECVNTKLKVVEEDFRDSSIRNILNFGHTVAHGVEVSSNFKVSHGFAVSLGMLVALKISEKVLGLTEEAYPYLVDIYKKLGIPCTYKVDNYSSVLYAIKHDKKNENAVNFVLLQEIGRCKIKVPIDDELIDWAIKNSIDKEC